MPKTSNKGRTLAKNAAGVWEIKWTEWDDARQRWRSKRVSTRCTDRAAAERFLADLTTATQAVSKLAATPTVGDLAADYETAAKARGVGATQFAVLEKIVRELGHVRATDLDTQALAEYRRRRNVADGTLRRELGVLRAVLGHAIRHRRLAHADAPHIDLPPPSQPREKYLTAVQEADLRARTLAYSIGEPRLHRVTRFIHLALRTGARHQAILDLTWDRVDLHQRSVDFRVPGTRVSKKRRVPVPIDDVLLPVLEQAYQERRDFDPHVVDRGLIRTAYRTFIRQTPYPWASPHVLRHTCATLLLQAGATIWSVAGILGDTPETVQHTYGHHAQDDLRRAIMLRGNP